MSGGVSARSSRSLRRVLVVKDSAGRVPGTYKVRSGAEEVFNRRDLPQFKAAVARHLAGIPQQSSAAGAPASSFGDESAAVEAPPLAGSLNARVPGQSVLEALFAIQDQHVSRSRLQRLLGISPLATEARAWYWGAVGEMRVGQELSKLGPGWHALHAVPMGRADRDVDHVVVGPPGVVTINTKNHSGQRVWIAGRKFMVAGKFYPHIPRAEHEAARASERLSPDPPSISLSTGVSLIGRRAVASSG